MMMAGTKVALARSTARDGSMLTVNVLLDGLVG
jgi:hypothetical protein